MLNHEDYFEMRKENVLRTKSFAFAVRIVKFHQFLKNEGVDFVLIKQVLRSGTSIGALVRESENAESKKDFIHKLNIALKEADETQYWLELLLATEIINDKMYQSIYNNAEELVKILIASLKTTRFNLKRNNSQE